MASPPVDCSSKTSEDSIEGIAGGPVESSQTTSSTAGPTGTPTQSPSENPTPSPTAGPTPSPTPSPVLPSHPFATNAELKAAINEYLGQGCPNDLNCQARSDYGGAVSRAFYLSMVPDLTNMCLLTIQIGDWDVSNVEDLSRLFLDDSDAPISEAAAFNEPINWDTGM